MVGALVFAHAAEPRLVDVAGTWGIKARNTFGGERRKDFILETTGNGAVVFDYDGDGRQDLLILNGPAGAPSLYRADGTGVRFFDKAAAAGITHQGWAQAACSGDIDNDGHPDLLITYYGTNRLYRNSGRGTFTDVTSKWLLPVSGTRFGSGCTFLDYDRDGRLDLFIANYVNLDLSKTPKPGSSDNCKWKEIPVMCGPRGLPLATNILYHQEANGTFRDVSERTGILRPGGRYALQAVTADFDDDGWPDIYVACDMTPSLLFRNRGDGTFEERGAEAGVAYNFDGRLQAGMGVAVGDYDNDGRLDIAKTNFSGDLTSLFHNDDGRFFTDVSREAGLGVRQLLGWGIAWWDVDDDGWRDLLLVNGHVYPEVEGSKVGDRYLQETLLFRNLANGRFRDVSREAGPGLEPPRPSRGLALGDLDGDGRPEAIIVNMNSVPAVLKNESPGGAFLNLLLEGTRSNRSAIGARVTVEAAGRRWIDERMSGASFYSQHSSDLHFGLGEATTVSQVTVRWPSGAVDHWTSLPVNSHCALREGKSEAVCRPYQKPLAQLDQAPEFSSPGGFRKSAVDTAIDSAAHVSAQRLQSAKGFARSVSVWRNEPAASPQEGEAFAAALRLFEAGSFAAAARAFDAGPASWRMQMGSGVAFFAQGEYGIAAQRFAKTAAAWPRDPRVIPYLEQVLDSPEAASQVLRLAQQMPGNAEAQFAHGLLLLARPDPEGARTKFRIAARLAPRDARPPYELAGLTEDTAEAITLLSKAIQLDPAFGAAHYRIAQLYQRSGDVARAENHFAEFRRLKAASNP